MSRFSRGLTATGAGRGRWLVLTLGLVGSALLLLVSLAADNGDARSGRTTVILGQTASEPDPSCPDLPCQAIGSVTGFQLNNGQTRTPFLVRHSGTIKSWSLTLAQPTRSQRAATS